MLKSASKWLSSSLALLGLVIIFGLMLAGEIRQWNKKKNIDAEIEQLTRQANELEQKNQEISDSLSFLNTSDFKEKVAREQLSLKKEGELVYNITKVPEGSTGALASNAALPGNVRKWYMYFFSR